MTKTEFYPKSEVTFLIWTQRIAERKISKVNLNNSVLVQFTLPAVDSS